MKYFLFFDRSSLRTRGEKKLGSSALNNPRKKQSQTRTEPKKFSYII